MIWIMIIRAAIGTFALWCSFKLGRYTAVYELLHKRDGDIEAISDDIVRAYNMYEEFHGGDSK